MPPQKKRILSSIYMTSFKYSYLLNVERKLSTNRSIYICPSSLKQLIHSIFNHRFLCFYEIVFFYVGSFVFRCRTTVYVSSLLSLAFCPVPLLWTLLTEFIIEIFVERSIGTQKVVSAAIDSEMEAIQQTRWMPKFHCIIYLFTYFYQESPTYANERFKNQ